jgi:hypothetical protein
MSLSRVFIGDLAFFDVDCRFTGVNAVAKVLARRARCDVEFIPEYRRQSAAA